MNEILHANIFFFIASIATVAFAIMICIVFYHVIKILKSLRAMIEKVEAESDVIVGDIHAVRDFVFKGGFVSHLMRLVVGESVNRRSRTRKATKDIIITDKE